MNAQVREATLDDHAAVSRLMSSYGLETKTYEQWGHLWVSNPANSAYAGKWPIGWAIENEKQEVVGFLGNIPTLCQLGEKRLLATTASAWVVDKPYRSASLALVSRYFAQKNVDILLNTTARYEAGQVFSAFRAKRMPLNSYEDLLFWITDYAGFTKPYARKINLPKPFMIPLASAASAYGAVAALKERVLGAKAQMPQGEALKELAEFDERFDSFWQELCKQSRKLMTFRDRASLNWHFKFALENKRLWIFSIERNSQLKAFALFYRQDNPDLGLTRVRLIDFQSLDLEYDDAASCARLTILLNAAIDRCQKNRIHMLEAVGCSGKKRMMLEHQAQFRRKLDAWPFFYRANDKALEVALENPEVWDPTPYDGDGSL